MVVKYYGSESNRSLDSLDEEILELMVHKYGANLLLERDGNNYSISNTGGSVAKGKKGFLKSLPSLAITGILSMPLLLINALGILKIRQEKRWSDWTDRMNTLDPRWWTEYFANMPSAADREKRRKENNENPETQQDSSLSTSDSSPKDEIAEPTADEINKAAFKTCWIYLSNGDIIRYRCVDEKSINECTKEIVSKMNPVYKKMNDAISNGEISKFVIYFDDGEIMNWAGKDADTAKEGALKSRKEICDVLNAKSESGINLDKLEYPKIIKCRMVKKEPMEYPKDVPVKYTMRQPDNTVKSRSALPELIYDYESFKQYKITMNSFTLNVPSISPELVKDVTKKFFSLKIVSDNFNTIDKTNTVYKINIADGDVYYISASSSEDAKEIARKFWKEKMDIVQKSLNVDKKMVEMFIQMVNEYNVKTISEIKNCDILEKKAIKEPTDNGTIKRMKTKSEYDDAWKIAI